MPKKQARGSSNVGRKKTSVTRMFRRNVQTATKIFSFEESASGDEINRASRSNCAAASNQNWLSPSLSDSEIRIRTFGNIAKEVRFEENSEWVDVEDEGELEPFDETCYEHPGLLDDEYILI